MSLAYSYIEEEHKNLPLPPARPNGGLYTGNDASGPWGAIPVPPEAVVYTTQNLKSANPPTPALSHPYTFLRPGNNQVTYPTHTKLPNYNFNVVGSS